MLVLTNVKGLRYNHSDTMLLLVAHAGADVQDNELKVLLCVLAPVEHA